MFFIVLQTKSTKSRGERGRLRGKVWSTEISKDHIEEFMADDSGAGEVLRICKSSTEVSKIMDKYHNACCAIQFNQKKMTPKEWADFTKKWFEKLV